MAYYNMIVLLALTSVPSHLWSAVTPGAQSVCTVLENLDRFRGREVTISGTLAGSPHHGYSVSDGNRDHCRARRRLFLRSAIKLYHSADPDVYRPGRRFQTPNTAFDAVLDAAAKARMADHDEQVLIEVHGDIESPPEIFVVCDRANVCWGNGFGPGKSYAAAIVVKSIKILPSQEPLPTLMGK